jgi:hypothetical protein
MLAWFDTRTAVAYAKTIAELVGKVMPLDGNTNKVLAPAKRADKFERILKQISRSDARGFNVYQKAKFGTALKWDLSERGYAKDFADELVRLVLARLG